MNSVKQVSKEQMQEEEQDSPSAAIEALEEIES
jgi:hypothetical protein